MKKVNPTVPLTPGRGSSQGRISDFSRVADKYDSTRDLPEGKLADCYNRLVHAGLLPQKGKILDAGCGTGQASLVLAARGYRVLGIDVSRDMTLLAQSKVRPEWQANYMVADVRKIPAEDGSFDAAVVSKLFQHVQDWQQVCHELIRVIRAGGCIVQVNERGAFSNAVRRHFSQRADELGFRGRYVGLNPHRNGDGELAAFMQSQGCQPATVDLPSICWDMFISYGEALRRIRERLFAEFWYLPEPVYEDLLASTQTWVESQPDGANTIQQLRPYLTVKVFQTPRDY